MGYNFKDLKTAQRLKNFAESNLGGNGYGPGRQKQFNIQEVILVKTPAAGCLAREATTPDESGRNEWKLFFATCEVVSTYSPDAVVYRKEADEIRTINKPEAQDIQNISDPTVSDWKDEASMTVQVYNPHNVHMEGSQFYIAVLIDGTYVFICHGSAFRLLKTPVAGIPGRSGTTLGKATCELYHLEPSSGDAVITQDLDGGSAVEYTVHNMATGAVAGGVYVQACRINGFLVVNWEEC